MLRVEFLKMARMRLALWLALAVIGLTLVRGLVFPPDPGLPWPGLWSSGIVSAVLAILTAVTVGEEFGSGRFRVLAGRGVARWRPLVAQWTALVLAGVVFLVGVEALAVLVGVRPELHPAELGRAWLALWPLVSLVMATAVLARNGGLPMVLGILLLLVECFYALIVGPMSELTSLSGFPAFLRPFTEGWAANLYQQTLSFNSANWTYLAEWRRAPVTLGLILLSHPRTAGLSAVVLAAYTAGGLGLSLGVACRRELSEPAANDARAGWRSRRARGEKAGHVGQRRLPRWTGRGPTVARLVYAHLWHLRRTSLVKISAAVALLFPLTLVLLTWSAGEARKLFEPLVPGGAPLVVAACMFPVAPLAVVTACLAVSNELGFGTRRATLARGVTRLQAIAAESIALVALAGGLLARVMVACIAIGAAVGGTVPLGSAALAVAVGMLVAAVYAGVVQVGAAVSRSSLGALLAGLGFLVADWAAFLAPTAATDPGPATRLVPYTVTAMAYGLVSGQSAIAASVELAPPPVVAAVGLLAGLALATHLLAALIARWRDV
jgi:ABC-type transport system involved in multi-copper enzyme maturation permease subunit